MGDKGGEVESGRGEVEKLEREEEEGGCLWSPIQFGMECNYTHEFAKHTAASVRGRGLNFLDSRLAGV